MNLNSSLACSAAAIGAGADVIEKHITIRSKKPLEDSESAIFHKEFLILKKNSILAWNATNFLPLKKIFFGMSKVEKKYKISVRKVYVSNKKLYKGHKFKSTLDLDLKRSSLKNIIYNFKNIKNKVLQCNLNSNTVITKKTIK
jgi:sialic acid synthase SpsE